MEEVKNSIFFYPFRRSARIDLIALLHDEIRVRKFQESMKVYDNVYPHLKKTEDQWREEKRNHHRAIRIDRWMMEMEYYDKVLQSYLKD
jgi:hypothetical protein